jgi:hypothetical protein
MFAYTVSCDFDDPAVAVEWLAWLRDEHLGEVCAAGALDAEAVRLDPPPGVAARCEARYHFASRPDFQRYERDHAPRLRAEGLKRFPLERGLRYTRATGEVVAATVMRMRAKAHPPPGDSSPAP